MAKHWRIHPHDAGRIESLERAAGISPIVAQLLLARGIGDHLTARSFLNPKMTELRDPEQLPGLTAAADRVFSAATSGRRIVIYGDYDADGMTATAILYRCLQLLGAEQISDLNHDFEVDSFDIRLDRQHFIKLLERGFFILVVAVGMRLDRRGAIRTSYS